MISDTINQKIADAMRARNDVALRTLRMLSSALNYERIAKQKDFSEKDEIVVVRREVKKRQEAIEAYKKAGAEVRASEEEKEMKFLQEFLPPEMPREELNRIVDEAIAQTGAKVISDMGRVMGIVIPKVSGRIDNGEVAALIKTKLGITS